MADTVLDFSRQASESLVVSLRDKYRVVSKTALSLLVVADTSAHDALNLLCGRGSDECDHGAELRIA